MVSPLRYGESTEHFGELRPPTDTDMTSLIVEDTMLVVLIHGGFWRDHYRLDLMHPLAESLADHGYASWNIEYRRVGPTGGGPWATTSDVADAIDFQTQRPWKKLAVIGHSAGGHLALWNASRDTARRFPDLTVGLAPVADVVLANQEGTGDDATPNFFGGDVSDVPEAYAAAQPDPHRWAGRVVLVHGSADDNVPIHQSTRLEHAADRLYLLEAVDHFQVIDPTHESWKIVLDELAHIQAQP